MTTQTMQSNTSTKAKDDQEITSVERCAELLIDHVQQLRQEQNLTDEEEISIYITDVPLVHSTISEYGSRLKEATNATDIVQVNIKAGNPMPKNLPHHQIGRFSKEPVTVAIDQV